MHEYVFTVKVLGNPVRMRILRLLLDAEQELCVCEIVDVLEENQFNVSRHLRKLEEAGLVVSSKKGKWVMYRVNPELDDFRVNLLQAIREIPCGYFQEDIRCLHERLSLREEGECVVGISPSRYKSDGK